MKHILYCTYRGMITRCYDSRCKGFHNYGGRGIKVCKRWIGKDGFKNFCIDMGERPTGFSINRINNDGHYSPDNCEWASRETQQNNRRNNTRFTLNGETMTLAQWSKKIGIDPFSITRRKRKGWPMEEVLSSNDYKGYLISKQLGIRQPSRIDPNWMISH